MSCCEQQPNDPTDGRIRIENGVIDEVRRGDGVTFVTVTYKMNGEFGLRFVTTVTLVVGKDTKVQDESGNIRNIRDLKEGMRIDAVASSKMTRSLPPQTEAFRIRILQQKEFVTTRTRVLRVDPRNGFLYTGIPGQPSRQIRFTVSEDTKILSRKGNPIRLWNLRRGQFIRVEHANFMTSSIPPQTAAYRIQVM